MGFIGSLFGAEEGNLWTTLLALLIVIALIVFLVWALKFVMRASRSVGIGRNRRVTVTENIPVDAKRQLLLIRRDNVEHLVMVGGGADFVVEGGIPVTTEERRASAGTAERPHLNLARRAPAPERKQGTHGTARHRAPGLERQAASTGTALAVPGQPPQSSPPAGAPEPGVDGTHSRSGITALEKLRQMTRSRPDGQSAGTYPGLLRPVTRHEPVTDAPHVKSADAPAPDSDMSGSDVARGPETKPSAPGGDAGAASAPDPADWNVTGASR